MFFLVKRRAAVEGLLIVLGDTTKLVETSCYLVGKNNCTRKQHTLKAVVKVSRNIELCSCQTTHLKHKNSYQFSKSSNTILRRLADHVNATCRLNMKTRLRYRQTPSHIWYTAQPRSTCGHTAFISVRSLTAISCNKNKLETENIFPQEETVVKYQKQH